jgi:hypothetical protein
MSPTQPLTELAQFLEKAEAFIRPKREETLLSVMGMGHYENPLSDLLAFFLKPQAEHGLGLLFLKSFLSCIKADLQITEPSGISVHREAQTLDSKRPDFIIQGSTWLLMIEHKVWHGQNNPFASYEDLAKTLSGDQKQVLYAVLSPHGGSVRKNWLPVSYPQFTASLRTALNQHLLHAPATKWTLLAEEFLLHINTHILPAQTSMTYEEAAFVEQHQASVDQVERMAQQYREFLDTEVKRSLQAAMPGLEFSTKGERWDSDSWAIRAYCGTRWNQCNVVIWNSRNASGQGFYVSIYVNERHTEARKAFPDLHTWPEGKWQGFRLNQSLPTREEGMRELVSRAQQLSSLFPQLTPPPTTDQPSALS